MGETTELEYKYEVPDDYAFPDLTSVAAIDHLGWPVTHDLDAFYFDTPDGRLRQHEAVLRRRTGGDDEGWHLKLGGVGAQRTERHRPLDDAASPPRELLDALPIDLDPARLGPVARVMTRRTERSVQDVRGRSLASIAVDDVEAVRLADRARSAWREVEAELVDGEPSLLAEIDRILLATGARRGSVPKVVRALQP
jgi:inorganic triphosphatase YgiF